MVLNGEYQDWTITDDLQPSKTSLAQLAALERIGESVKFFCENPLVDWELPNFGELLKSKTIDYAGEEVSHALPLRLEELLPGLPEASVRGSLTAEDVADEVVKVWLMDPKKTLKPMEAWPQNVPTAKINATRSEWYRLVKVLHERNILAPIAGHDIFSVGGTPVLNGAFAVVKSGVAAPGESHVKAVSPG